VPAWYVQRKRFENVRHHAAEDRAEWERRVYLAPQPHPPVPMPTIHLTSADGQRTTVKAPAGESLMRAATDAGVSEIAADCGGLLTCATCHVYVSPAWADRLPPAAPDELSMLEMTAAERRPTSRLSCQIVLMDALDGLEVELPAQQY
jgi:2Fe-2S ferredoxin